MTTTPKTYTLLDSCGQPYRSTTPGLLGGHRRNKLYGRLDCPSALRALADGDTSPNGCISPMSRPRSRLDTDRALRWPLPDWLAELSRRAIADADPRSDAPGYRPDAALVNFYDQQARLGMHHDKDETINAPVVSFSVGDSCLFRFGNTSYRSQPYTDIQLQSGDVFVFSGPSRFAYRVVPKLFPDTAPDGCGITSGRLDITVSATGLPRC